MMREAPPTRVLVADDHAVVRRGLALLLNREPDFEVVAEAADGAEAVEKALAEQVGLVIPCRQRVSWRGGGRACRW